jgi:arginase family enzyme
MRAVRRHHPKLTILHIDAHSDIYHAYQLYFSMDIDGLDPAYAPGVSHREPGGLSTRQVIDLIHNIDQPIVAADIRPLQIPG